MKKTTFNTASLSAGAAVVKLADGSFLIPIERHGSDDYPSCENWDGDKGFYFSNNIQIVAATSYIFGGAVVVRKIDPSIPEVITFFNPDVGSVKFTF